MNKMKCQNCGNTAYLKNTGRQVGAAIGAAAGGTGTVAGATAIGATAGAATVGAATVTTAASLKAGALAGSFLGPVGIVAGAGIGGVLGFLVAVVHGASRGYKVGEVIDRNVIGEYYCPHCGHTFRA